MKPFIGQLANITGEDIAIAIRRYVQVQETVIGLRAMRPTSQLYRGQGCV